MKPYLDVTVRIWPDYRTIVLDPTPACCFCAHAVHGPGGCDRCPPRRGCNAAPWRHDRVRDVRWRPGGAR